jgi:hypothetical protein
MISNNNIPYDEISMEPTSGFDKTGRVFRWKGQIYRGIYSPYSAFYEQFFKSSLADELFQLGLIQTEYTQFQLHEFDIILKHKTIPVVSYPSEWSSNMLKDAALLTLKMQLRLVGAGLTLKDAHPWNILFDSCNPLFIDIGSITEASKSLLGFFIQQFRVTFLFPLLLKSGGYSNIVDARMAVHCGIDDMPVYKLLFINAKLKNWLFHWRLHRKIDKIMHRNPRCALELMRDQIVAISNTQNHISTKLSFKNPSSKNENTSSKRKAVIDLVEKLKPKSILEIGIKDSIFGDKVSNRDTRIIMVDNNNNYVNELYQYGVNHQVKIFPICMDINEPSMAHGWGKLTAATQRFRSDLVLMLNIADYLQSKQGISLDHIAHYASRLTHRWAIIEIKLSSGKQLNSQEAFRKKNNTLPFVKETFSRYFSEVKVYHKVNETTMLFQCQSPNNK